VSSASGLRTVTATRYVAPLREGGSLPGLVEADDSGLYVVKFHGAGQGPRSLVAEVLAGELGRALGLAVPEQVIIDVDAALGASEPDPEIQELIVASGGANLGVDFLPGSATYSPAAGVPVDPASAADIVWLDALMTNMDRTAQNPNLLLWHKRLWAIDHGAALYLQHGGLSPAEHAERPFPQIAQHVLLGLAGSIEKADERLSPQVDRALLQKIVAMVPEQWLAGERPQTYVDYLALRLGSPRVFVKEAEDARTRA
jgi:hypothetical protein